MRLEQLRDVGFNTAPFICFAPRELDPVRLRKFFETWREPWGISLRHFHENENRFFQCPVAYEQTDWDYILRFCQEHNQQFFTLCNQAIPVHESCAFGSIWLLGRTNYIVEYARGPGTPRDIHNIEGSRLRHFQRGVGESVQGDVLSEILELMPRFYRFLEEERPIVVEFNVYPYPIGFRKEKVIFWEWRQGILHEASEVVSKLIAENAALRAENETLRNIIREALQK